MLLPILQSRSHLFRHLMTRPWKTTNCFHVCQYYPSVVGSLSLPRNKRYFFCGNERIKQQKSRTGLKPTSRLAENKTDIVELLRRQSTYDDVLHVMHDHVHNLNHINSEHVASGLRRMTEVLKPESDDLDDFRFTNICKVIHRRVESLHLTLLFDYLNSLLVLSPNEDMFLVKSIEAHLLFKLKQPDVKPGMLIQILAAHPERLQTTELRQTVYNTAKTLLLAQLEQITDPAELVSAMYLIRSSSSDELKKLWQQYGAKCSELSGKMNPKQLYRVINLMGQNQQRNLPLLYNLVNNLNRTNLALSAQHVSNLLSACSCLNFYNSALMENISQNAKAVFNGASQVTSPNVQAVTLSAVSMFQSCGILHWRHGKLLDCLATYLVSSSAALTSAATVKVLHGLTGVNYMPPPLAGVLPQLLTQLSDLMVSDPRSWLDAVWSLCVLGKLNKNLATSVLCEDFYQRLKREWCTS